ncbi:MAG: hypothetical protein WA647_19110 [Candidatus Acidiferrum sp.]
MSDELNVKIVVDAAQLQSGMANAANAVQSASVRMAESLKAAGMSAADAASALKNLGFSASESSAALKTVGLAAAETATQAQVAANSFNGMDRAMAMASGRIAGMAAGAGMLGGQLGRVAAYSPTLGPLLAGAFPVFAIAAFADIAAKLPEFFKEAADAVGGFSTEVKKAYAEVVSSNTQMLLENTRLKIQTEALNEIGAKGAAKYGIAIRDNVDAQKAWGATSAELLGMQQSLVAKINELTAAPSTVPFAQIAAEEWGKATTNVGQLRTELEEVNKALEAATRAQKELSEVGAPKAQAEQHTAGIEASQKALEEFNKEQEREGKEAEEAAVKRGNAEREAADAKERVDEEMAASSAEMAKHDLESWRSALVAKTALTEEQGKAQLAQIRANAELSEKVTAQHKGAGSPEIKNEAFAAYQQEVMAIQQLIAAEDQLQQKLKATGAAADDPKVLDSQKRQLELTQQMNAAMNAYLGTVHKVDEAWTADVTKAVNGVSAEFSRGVVSWMNGQQTFGRAMQHVWTSFADTVVSSLIKAGAQMIAQAALQKSISKSSQLSAAETAASNTWASVSAIPIIGPFLAPEAAAAAFAGVLAFDSGGMVPGYGPVPAIVHGGEMILNQSQQKALGSSGDTFHYHAGAGADTEQTRASSKEFFKLAKRELRRRSR